MKRTSKSPSRQRTYSLKRPPTPPPKPAKSQMPPAQESFSKDNSQALTTSTTLSQVKSESRHQVVQGQRPLPTPPSQPSKESQKLLGKSELSRTTQTSEPKSKLNTLDREQFTQSLQSTPSYASPRFEEKTTETKLRTLGTTEAANQAQPTRTKGSHPTGVYGIPPLRPNQGLQVPPRPPRIHNAPPVTQQMAPAIQSHTLGQVGGKEKVSTHPQGAPPKVPPRPNKESSQVSHTLEQQSIRPHNAEDVKAVQQAIREQRHQPQNDLQTLVREVTEGNVKPDSDSIYRRYNRGSNPLVEKTSQTFESEVHKIDHPGVTPGRFYKNNSTQEYTRGGYAEFSNKTTLDKKERVYINAKADHAPQVMQHVVNVMGKEKSGISSAKIFSPHDITSRNDGIVAYTDGNASAINLAASLRQYNKQRPGHLGDTSPLMTQKTGVPGVSIGQDPNITEARENNLSQRLGENNFYENTTTGDVFRQKHRDGINFKPSFGQVRADMIAQATQQPGVRDSQGNINQQKLQKETNELLELAGVNFENPSRNID